MACMQQEKSSYEYDHCEADKVKYSSGVAQAGYSHQKPVACATQSGYNQHKPAVACSTQASYTQHKPVACATQTGYKGTVANGQQHSNSSSNKHHGVGGQQGHSSGLHGLAEKVTGYFVHGHTDSDHSKKSHQMTVKPMHHDSKYHSSSSHHSSSSSNCEFKEEKKVYKSKKGGGYVKSETKIKKKSSFKSKESDSSSDSSDSESDNEGCKKKC